MSRIKTETGTSIIIPPDTERNDVIRIEGDPVGVKAAKNMLLELAGKMVMLHSNESLGVNPLLSDIMLTCIMWLPFTVC